MTWFQIRELDRHGIELGAHTFSHPRLDRVPPEELEREIVMGPVPEPRTVATCMGQMVWDTVAHGGQIAYLRGFFRGMGWFR